MDHRHESHSDLPPMGPMAASSPHSPSSSLTALPRRCHTFTSKLPSTLQEPYSQSGSACSVTVDAAPTPSELAAKPRNQNLATSPCSLEPSTLSSRVRPQAAHLGCTSIVNLILFVCEAVTLLPSLTFVPSLLAFYSSSPLEFEL